MNYFNDYNSKKEQEIAVSDRMISRIRRRVFPRTSSFVLAKPLFVLPTAMAMVIILFCFPVIREHSIHFVMDPKIALADSLNNTFIPDDYPVMKYRKFRIEQNSIRKSGKIVAYPEKEVRFWGYDLANTRTDTINKNAVGSDGKRDEAIDSILYSKIAGKRCVSNETPKKVSVNCNSIDELLPYEKLAKFESWFVQPTQSVQLHAEPYSVEKSHTGEQQPWGIVLQMTTQEQLSDLQLIYKTRIREFNTSHDVYNQMQITNGEVQRIPHPHGGSYTEHTAQLNTPSEDGYTHEIILYAQGAESEIEFQIQFNNEYSQIFRYNFSTQKIEEVNPNTVSLQSNISEERVFHTIYNEELSLAWYAMEYMDELGEPILFEIEYADDKPVYHVQFSTSTISELSDKLNEQIYASPMNHEMILDFRFLPQERKILEYSIQKPNGKVWRRVTVEEEYIVTDVNPEEFFTESYWKDDLQNQSQKEIHEM